MTCPLDAQEEGWERRRLRAEAGMEENDPNLKWEVVDVSKNKNKGHVIAAFESRDSARDYTRSKPKLVVRRCPC